jgi:hypothetical protein
LGFLPQPNLQSSCWVSYLNKTYKSHVGFPTSTQPTKLMLGFLAQPNLQSSCWVSCLNPTYKAHVGFPASTQPTNQDFFPFGQTIITQFGFIVLTYLIRFWETEN